MSGQTRRSLTMMEMCCRHLMLLRILKNKMAKTYIQKEKEGATMMELEKYTLGSLKKAVFEGNVDEGSLMAGQVAGMIHEIKPVQQILQEMMDELKVAYQNLEI